MSSPSNETKDVDPALLYAPQWARDRALTPADNAAAPPIEWPPRGRRLDNVRIFGEDRALLEARRELALQPEKVPEPPQPDPSDQIVGRTVLRICGVAGAAAVVAWTLVSMLDARSARREPVRETAAAARPVAVAPARQDSPPVVTTARLDENNSGSTNDEAGQQPTKDAILGPSAAVAASPAAAEARNRARSAEGRNDVAQCDHQADGP
jgi:hypothetical protein